MRRERSRWWEEKRFGLEIGACQQGGGPQSRSPCPVSFLHQPGLAQNFPHPPEEDSGGAPYQVHIQFSH